jgi:hypothetical protein
MSVNWNSSNPNSQHQTWARWSTTVIVPYTTMMLTVPFFEYVQTYVTKVYRPLFGETGICKIETVVKGSEIWWTVEVLADDNRAIELEFQQFIKTKLDGAYKAQFGQSIIVETTVKILAGDSSTGKPPAQMIVLPVGPDESKTRMMFGKN